MQVVTAPAMLSRIHELAVFRGTMAMAKVANMMSYWVSCFATLRSYMQYSIYGNCLRF